MSIELYTDKNLLRTTDDYIPLLSETKKKLAYYSDRITQLEYENKTLKDKLEELKQYETVKEFYHALSGYCYDMNIDANILQCGFRVINKKCKIFLTCNTRKKFLKQIGV